MQLKNISTGEIVTVENFELLNLLAQQVKDTSMKSTSFMATHSDLTHLNNNPSTLSIQETVARTSAEIASKLNSLLLNGIRISKIDSKYYVSEVNQEILSRKFPNNSIQVGDEVKIYTLYDIYKYHSNIIFLRFFRSIIFTAIF